ncbi:uncharacterized protein METZ01_LOCUS428016 [marine metagenome]|uniref:Uncharacterized protein n=1 Tax=marine metagenome TaxID=408172 RepID=A0A382XVM6_9ZZZZ
MNRNNNPNAKTINTIWKSRKSLIFVFIPLNKINIFPNYSIDIKLCTISKKHFNITYFFK